MATQTLLTYEQYRDLPEVEGISRELDEGQVIEMARASFLHGMTQGRVFQSLANFADRTGADFLISLDTSFLLAPDTERAPDVCAVRRPSYEAMERVRGVLRGCPDLAAEVISESDTALNIDRKISQYLRAGATAVWTFYPDTRHILVRRQSGETAMLGPGQTLEEPDLFPGLKIPVDQIFKL